MPGDALPSWVWLEELPEPGHSVTLGDEDAHHVTRVCRARVGEPLTLTDGRGAVARARLIHASPRAVVEVESLARNARTAEATVMCGSPEGDRGDWLVEKLAELGIAAFQPVDCERAPWKRSATRVARWRRLAVAALRQSRRSHLLEVSDPEPLEQALDRLAGGEARWVADPRGPAAAEVRPPAGRCVGMIGPGSGLSDREQTALADLGFGRMHLADCVLRSETAAMAWAAWWAGGGSRPNHGGSAGSPKSVS
ncbi:MAG: 16S rRNA (uracil(1498)-N(3))-methyltransferase [Candidatus Eisenbacteria bacterium]|uniref:Ribosomal RNA small subunit methyltransferase E n=1 Tax=Eiseniibacteriota bacterium TaxID=2212470 RepID=A0A538TPG5_UNCEI|nr:MAG: 16S rRNA (uracil(1498)-N(3))-methyltransferase [Candidatus Eisenbacteria bacterium]